MDASERREQIQQRLSAATTPISATSLAQQLGVSRQIIVGDVALLRAAGAEISATPRGYIIRREDTGLIKTVACRHSGEAMEAELNAMVDLGCTVLDVIVEHPIYGQLTGPLRLSNRYDVQQFILRNQELSAHPLSLLTEGIHLHTVSCADEAAYQRLLESLRSLHILLEA